MRKNNINRKEKDINTKDHGNIIQKNKIKKKLS